MKTRLGFVSNSSSASFLVKKVHLNDDQIEKIKAYVKCGRLKKCNDVARRCVGCCPDIFAYNDYGWTITENDDEVAGYTSMANFDMLKYLTYVVGLREESVSYERS